MIFDFYGVWILDVGVGLEIFLEWVKIKIFLMIWVIYILFFYWVISYDLCFWELRGELFWNILLLFDVIWNGYWGWNEDKYCWV